MSIKDCSLIYLPKISDDRGSLIFAEQFKMVPFNIKRIFYMYGNIGERGNHAHKKTKQFIIAMSGSFKIKIDDGKDSHNFDMVSPDYGLYISKKIWVNLYDFSKDSVCLVLASDYYKKDDYIYDYEKLRSSLIVKI